MPSRSLLAADPHRPQYHFLPPCNWMNDPNGVIQWKGQYHLFYQHNPTGALWGNMHWGHAVSPDLIHWSDLPIALAPAPDSPDATGCFSGCAVDNGVPTLIYTGTTGQRNEIQTQCLATSRDDLLTWEKYLHNPVLSEVPAEARQTSDFRDPFVWKDSDRWYMVVASRIAERGGVVFLYRSRDLREWEYLHPLLTGADRSEGVLWECPNFFPLGDQWVLIVSAAHTGEKTDSVFYFVGEYKDERFTPAYRGILDYGCVYAPLSFVDDQRRRLLFGWIREERPNEVIQRAGWAGVQTIPRVLSLDADNHLRMMLVPELESIRGKHHHCEAITLDQPISLDSVGTSLDILAEFEVESGGNCGLILACATAGDEGIYVRYDTAAQRLIVEKRSPSLDAVGVPLREAPHPLTAGETLKLRILFDGSVIEIIANDRTSLSTRFYRTAGDSAGVQVFGDKARLRSLDIWEMPSIYRGSDSEVTS
jgi:beta-fructofuranosidase